MMCKLSYNNIILYNLIKIKNHTINLIYSHYYPTQEVEMEYYKLSSEEVLKDLNSRIEGLTHEEAEERLNKYGKNELTKEHHISKFKLFLSQFNNFIVWILIGAVIILGISGEFVNMVVILIILILNAILGFIQEYRAERSIEALEKLASFKAKVIRDGNEIEINTSELVLGDIIILEAGERVPADARLIKSHNLETQEAPLTGESLPVEKQSELLNKKLGIADRTNMIFSGTNIVLGSGKAVVVSTGMDTEIGKIANLIHKSKPPLTPLQQKLEHLGKVLGVGVIILAVLVFLIRTWQGEPKIETLIYAVSLAVAAVPEGLPAVVTITLAIGAKRMIKKNALIRKLPAVETLGSTNVICTDKTGTLTHNEMTVKKVYVDDQIIEVQGSGYEIKGEFERKTSSLNQLLKVGVLCNNANFKDNKEHLDGEINGDPTEIALLVSGAKLNLNRTELEKQTPRIDEIPFDSDRKLMSTIHKQGKKKFMLTKGAPEELIQRCNRILINGEISVLSRGKRTKILSVTEQFGKEALRILGFAYKEIQSSSNSETSLIFVGLQAMIDPPREEAKSSIAKCKKAGIKVIMITGDHKITANAIANDIGIDGRTISGEELDNMQDNQLRDEIDKIGVFARASPEHKLRIVRALQSKNYVVAMTGDGVNDAPALRKADIGVAMGITGTDVTKEAGAMILTDDNFSSIVSAVEEGRNVFNNIQKFIEYLLSCNMGEVLTIFIAVLLGFPAPLIAVQILLMNLITDGLPATALAVEPEEPGVMERKPRKKNARVVDRRGFIQIIVIGIIMMIGSLGVFRYAYKGIESNYMYATTMAFTTLVIFQMFHVLNSKSLYLSVFKVGLFKNKWLIGAIGLSLTIQLLLLYTPLNIIFNTVPLSIFDWGIILLVTSSVFVVREIWKLFDAERV